MIITLFGNPVSTGTIYKTICRGNYPCTYLTKRGSDMKEEYRKQAKSQWDRDPLTGEVKLKINLYLGTKRKADWDNFHKISMDALTGIVWQDDSQIIEANVFKGYDKETPRIEVELLNYVEQSCQN